MRNWKLHMVSKIHFKWSGKEELLTNFTNIAVCHVSSN